MYWSLEHQLRVGGGGIANGRGTLDNGFWSAASNGRSTDRAKSSGPGSLRAAALGLRPEYPSSILDTQELEIGTPNHS